MKNYYDEEFNYEDTEDYLLEMWTTCKLDEDDENYKVCDDCEYHDECLINAEDSRDGYELFCDIVSDAYGSVDDFWECNGI